MAQRTDWYPKKRDVVLQMAWAWKENAGPRAVEWGIPPAQIDALTQLYTDAKNAWEQENDPERKTLAVVQRARFCFRALEVKMRYIKKHWLIYPDPIDAEGMVLLMLPVPDTTPSDIAAPSALVEAGLSFPGVHLVELAHFKPVNGQHSPNPKSDYGVSVHFGLTGTPTENHPIRLGEAPTTGKQLPDYRFVTGGKLLLDLEGESGNTIYLALCYENQKGAAGPFGAIMKAVVP